MVTKYGYKKITRFWLHEISYSAPPLAHCSFQLFSSCSLLTFYLAPFTLFHALLLFKFHFSSMISCQAPCSSFKFLSAPHPIHFRIFCVPSSKIIIWLLPSPSPVLGFVHAHFCYYLVQTSDKYCTIVVNAVKTFPWILDVGGPPKASQNWFLSQVSVCNECRWLRIMSEEKRFLHCMEHSWTDQ